VSRRLLQICPYDGPPFNELCARYVEAAQLLDCEMTSVFLAPPTQTPMEYGEYLDARDLSDTRALRKALKPYAQPSWSLVVCHRYRSYWSAVGTGLMRNPCVALAHEFGFFDRSVRRLRHRFMTRDVRMAGVSLPVAEELSSMTGEVLVLPNVANPEKAKKALLSRSQARAMLQVDGDALLVGVVGRLHYKKRPQVALQAFQQFAGRQPEAQLIFVGGGEQPQLENGLDRSKVHFLGELPNAAHVMKAFDVLLHPTRVEAFGMVVLEAMLADVPVVALPLGGPGFVLGDLGIYADEDTPKGFSAALQRALLIDRPTYANAAGRRVAEHFSVPQLAAALAPLMADS